MRLERLPPQLVELRRRGAGSPRRRCARSPAARSGDTELGRLLHQPAEAVAVARADRERQLRPAGRAARPTRSPPPSPRPRRDQPPVPDQPAPSRNATRSPSRGPPHAQVMLLALVEAARAGPRRRPGGTRTRDHAPGRGHRPPAGVHHFVPRPSSPGAGERRPEQRRLRLLHAGEDRRCRRAGARRRSPGGARCSPCAGCWRARGPPGRAAARGRPHRHRGTRTCVGDAVALGVAPGDRDWPRGRSRCRPRTRRRA